MYYWTGVGSRETPLEFRQMMRDIAHYLALDGWILRSGGAIGADSFFEEGVSDPTKREIYLPKWRFNGREHNPEQGYYNAQKLNGHSQAKLIAEDIHPKWELCDLNSQLLHTRNVFQVLGKLLIEPSSFLVCWAEVDFHGDITGGTRTAWMLAKRHNIPCYNLNFVEDFEKIDKWLSKMKASSV